MVQGQLQSRNYNEDGKNVGQQDHVLITRTARASEPEYDCSNLSAAS